VTPFEFAEYLDLADELVARSDEAAWRSAISRAYYAVLHVAYQALPLSLRGTISHRATHRATWQFYMASSVQVCHQIGHAGTRLRDARVEADYRAIAPVSPMQALRLVTHARQTLDRIHRHGYQP
jgi:uncharacterized protein (UPF0332 family)